MKKEIPSLIKGIPLAITFTYGKLGLEVPEAYSYVFYYATFLAGEYDFLKVRIPYPSIGLFMPLSPVILLYYFITLNFLDI